MILGVELILRIPEWPRVWELIRFVKSVQTVVDSMNGFNIWFSGVTGQSGGDCMLSRWSAIGS